MPAPTFVKPNLLNDPGWLYCAPIGTSLPTNTVVGSVFTDAWSAPWIWLGASTTGSVWHSNLSTSAVEVAEVLDAIAWRSTGRTATVDFSLASYTAANLAIALNGATKTVTGATTTTLTQIDPPALGAETRFMLGWESTDATVRKVAFQCINSGDIAETFAKAPAFASIPFAANCELPASPAQLTRTWTAGVGRA